jgi:hypothetical protein
MVRGHARAVSVKGPTYAHQKMMANHLGGSHSPVNGNLSYRKFLYHHFCSNLKNPKSAYEAADILNLHGQSSNSASSCYAPPSGAVCILHNRNTPGSPRRTPAVLGERSRFDSNFLPAAFLPTRCRHTGHSRLLVWWRKRLFSLSTGRFQRRQRLNSQILRRVTDEPSTRPEHGQLIGLLEPSHFWVVGASSWADINKLNLLTNIPWIAAPQKARRQSSSVLRKAPLAPTYHLGGAGGVPKLISGKMPMRKHANKHKNPNLPQLPADRV